MGNFLTVVVSGLSTGMLYGLIGLGLVLVYRASKVLNFAYGDMVTVLAYLAYTLAGVFHLPWPVLLGCTVCLGALLGIVVKAGLVDPLGRQADATWRLYGLYDESTLLNLVIGTMGLSLVLEGAEAAVWGTSVTSLPSVAGNLTWTVGTFHVAVNAVVTILAGAAVTGGLALLLERTRIGRQIQATYENPFGATLVGVDVRRVYTAVWIISLVAAAVAAIFATPVTYLSSTSLVSFSFIGFVAIIVGGLTNVWGAVLGGIVLGVIQNLVAGYVSSGLEQIVIFLFVLAVLLVRPYGLFANPRQYTERV
ncbi:MAG: branched-chain amino acid ABC transporter permease [Actinomycetia bacterium]|nr:branched-chain amino acid ABC transporter permease [Actinomycetes bacterium]